MVRSISECMPHSRLHAAILSEEGQAPGLALHG